MKRKENPVDKDSTQYRAYELLATALEEHREYGVPSHVSVGEGEMDLVWESLMGYRLYVTVWPAFLWDGYGEYTLGAGYGTGTFSKRVGLEEVYAALREFVQVEKEESLAHAEA
jgi:hypothetical protein